MNKKNKEIILKERAEKLKNSQYYENLNQKYIEVLVFKLSQENYGIETKYIKEVYPVKDLTILPCVPSYIYGVINVRRKIYSIVDLKYFFGLTDFNDDSNKKIIILENNENSFGLIIDVIEEIKLIKQEELQTQLPILTDLRKEFLKGIAFNNLIVLDGYKLINNDAFIVNENVTI